MEKLLQLQTTAANKATRPSPTPIKTNWKSPSVTTGSQSSMSSQSSSSSSSSSSTASSSERVSLDTCTSPVVIDEFVRCSRCKRSASLSSGNPFDAMVNFGLNLYYCQRCASIVGYPT